MGEDTPTLAHRNVVGGIEADGGEIAERAHLPAAVSAPHRITAILNQPQTVFARKGGDRIQVERVPKSVSQNDGARARTERLLQRANIHVVRGNTNIEKDRQQA